MEIPISELESYFGIKLSEAYDDLIEQIQLQAQDQEIDESAWCNSQDCDVVQD